MNTEQLAQLFRRYADEPDVTFLTQADVALYLSLGYDQFRALATRTDPYAYATSIDCLITPGTKGFTDYDLTQGNVNPTGANTPSLFGPNPNDAGTPLARMERLLAVERITEIDGMSLTRLKATISVESFRGNYNSFYLRDQTLRLSSISSKPIRITYVPTQSIGLGGAVFNPTWESVVDPGTGVFIDDFGEYHQLIALYAHTHYAITDAADNPILVKHRQRLEGAFIGYIQQRQYEGTHYVQVVEDLNDTGDEF